MRKHREIKVLFIGYSGENNTGAESRIVTIATDVKSVFNELNIPVRITTPTLSEKNLRRYLKDTDIKIIEVGHIGKFILNIIRVILQWHDILILVEGASFTQHFSKVFIGIFLFATLVAKLCRKKVVAYALDCGEFSPRVEKIFRWIANKIDLIIVRSEDAAERMKKAGIKKEIHITTDTAFQYKAPEEKYAQQLLNRLNIEPPLVGICPKEFFWFPIKVKLWGKKEDFFHYPLYFTWTPERREKSKIVKEAFVKFVDYCIEEHNLNCVLIAMERMDEKPTVDIYNLVKNKDKVRVITSNEYDLDDITSILSKLRFLVSTRYHALVLSMQAAIPMITVSSDIRCEGLFKELNMMEYYIPHNIDNLYEVLINKTKLLIENEPNLKKIIEEAYVSYLDKCLYNRTIFKEWLKKQLCID